MSIQKSLQSIAQRRLGRPAEALDDGEKRVLASAVEGTTIARDVSETFERQSTIGERISDRIAEIGGSWAFIIGFIAFLGLWVVWNSLIRQGTGPDPYPYIFLNLILSMIAALQAPVIMMSQNRAADRDRLDASHDYEVNLKAEIEILALHDKLDGLREADLGQLSSTLDRIAARLDRLEDLFAARSDVATR